MITSQGLVPGPVFAPTPKHPTRIAVCVAGEAVDRDLHLEFQFSHDPFSSRRREVAANRNESKLTDVSAAQSIPRSQRSEETRIGRRAVVTIVKAVDILDRPGRQFLGIDVVEQGNLNRVKCAAHRFAFRRVRACGCRIFCRNEIRSSAPVSPAASTGSSPGTRRQRSGGSGRRGRRRARSAPWRSLNNCT